MPSRERPMRAWSVALLAALVAGLSGCRCPCAAKKPQRELMAGPYRVAYASVPPNIDGKFDDPAWKQAAPLTRFYEYRQYGVRVDDTVVARLVWDKDNLYLAMQIKDEDLYCTYKENEKVLCRADVAELFVRPRDGRFDIYEFEFNMWNAIWDIHFVSLGGGGTARFDAFDSGAVVRATHEGTINDWTDRDKGWRVEVAIPMKAFKDVVPDGPKPGDRWRFNVAGYDFSAHRERRLLFTLCDGQLKGFKEYKLYPELEFVGS